MMIIALAQTTNEHVLGIFQFNKHTNPDDKGCIKNYWNALFGKRPKSALPSDFSEIVYCAPCDDIVWDGEASAMKNSGSKGVMA